MRQSYLSTLRSSVLCAALPATAALAQEEPIELDLLTVTGTGLETGLLRNPSSISVVGPREIESQAPVSVGRLLRDVPGVVVNDSTSPGIERISIRGEEGRRTTVLIDGQPLTDHSSYGQPILVDPESVERIEVVRGASSVVNGSRAVGGVVNIITKRGGNKPVQGSISGTYYSATAGWRSTATLRGAKDGFDYRVTADLTDQSDRRTPDGRLRPTDFNSEAFSAHLGYEVGSHYLAVKAQRFTMDANSYTDIPGFSISLPKRDLTKLSAFYEGRDLAPWLKRLSLDGYYQTIDREFSNEFVTPTPPFRVVGDSTDDQHTFGFNLRGELALIEGHRTAVGLQYENDFLDSDKSTFVAMPPPFGTTTTTHDEARIQTWSAYVNHEAPLTDALTGYVGGRLYGVYAELEKSDYRATGSNSDFRALGSAGLVYAPGDDWSLRASVAQGYGYPNLSQMFQDTTAQGGRILGNPDLKPEKSVTFELGGRYDAGGTVVDVTGFYTEADDYIDHQRVSGTSDSKYVNIGSATTIGLELALEQTIGDTGFTPYMSTTLIRRKHDFGAGDGETWDSGVPLISGRAGLRYDWDMGERLFGSVDVFLRGQGREQGRALDGSTEKADAFVTLNMAADFQYDDRLQVGVALNNILDEQYQRIDEVAGAGRNVTLFARLKF